MKIKNFIIIFLLSCAFNVYSSNVYESDFAVDSKDNIYLINKYRQVIEKIDANTGKKDSEYEVPLFKLRENISRTKYSISSDSKDFLFVAFNQTVRKFSPDGIMLGSYEIPNTNNHRNHIYYIDASLKNNIIVKLEYDYFSLANLDDPSKYKKLKIHTSGRLALNSKGQHFDITIKRARRFGDYGWLHLLATNLAGDEILNYGYSPLLGEEYGYLCSAEVLGVNDKDELFRTRYQNQCKHSSIERCVSNNYEYCEEIPLAGLDIDERLFYFMKSLVKNNNIYQLVENRNTGNLILFVHTDTGILLQKLVLM